MSIVTTALAYKVLARGFAGLALALAASAGQAQVFSVSPFSPVPPAGTLGTGQYDLVVAGGPVVITDVNVIINITHTFCGDLDILLIPPGGGSYIQLTSDNGGGGDNFTVTRFDQQSPILISSGVAPALAPFNGNFRPEGGTVIWRAAASIPLPGGSLGDLSALNGTNSNGTWSLLIDDDASADLGTLNYFSVELNNAADSNGPPPGSAPGLNGAIVSPNPVPEGQPVLITVNAAGGTVPASTGLTVVGDASAWGGSAGTALNDNGTGGDAVAGDGIWSVTITTGAFPGFRTFPMIISDNQGRTGNLSPGFTITASPSGACCVGDGCQQIREFQCSTAGGTFTAGVECGSFTYDLSTPTASVYESIAATGTNLGVVSNADDVLENVQIGFSFTYFGTPFTDMNVSSNGNIQFPPSNSAIWTNVAIPNAAAPNNMIAPLWDDLNPGVQGDVYVQTLGTAGTDLRTIVSWEGVTQFALTTNENFQVVLFENGSFEFRYGTITSETVAGDYSIGFESPTGLSGTSIPGFEIGAGDTARRFTFAGAVTICDGDACPACPADFDQDGGVTGSDIGAFFAEFERGGACGDTDLDGGITGSDIAAFFAAFEAGGC